MGFSHTWPDEFLDAWPMYSDSANPDLFQRVLFVPVKGGGVEGTVLQAGCPKSEGHLLLLVKNRGSEQRNRPGLGYCLWLLDTGTAGGAHDFSPAQHSV